MVTRDIHPKFTNWSVKTNILGVTYVVDGALHTTPYTTKDGVGIQHVLTGTLTQTIGSTRYRFNGWSDGSALTNSVHQSHR